MLCALCFVCLGFVCDMFGVVCFLGFSVFLFCGCVCCVCAFVCVFLCVFLCCGLFVCVVCFVFCVSCVVGDVRVLFVVCLNRTMETHLFCDVFFGCVCVL